MTKFIKIPVIGNHMSDSTGNGNYYAIDLDLYDDPFPPLVILKKGRVNLGKKYINRNIEVYMSKTPDNIKEKCDMILLTRGKDEDKWVEVKQASGEDLNVFTNGDICAPYKEGWYVKIFVKKESE